MRPNKLQAFFLQVAALVLIGGIIAWLGGFPPRAAVAFFQAPHASLLLLLQTLCLLLAWGILVIAVVHLCSSFIADLQSQSAQPTPPKNVLRSQAGQPASLEQANTFPLARVPSGSDPPAPLSFGRPETSPFVRMQQKDTPPLVLPAAHAEQRPQRNDEVTSLSNESVDKETRPPVQPAVGWQPPLPLPAQPRRVLSAFGLTHPGKRIINQDRFLVLNRYQERRYGLFVVADGLGGHENGEQASTLAVEIVRAIVEPELAESPEQDAKMLLQHAARMANEAVSEAGDGKMATTLVVALVRGNDSVSVVNVGDSRAYTWTVELGLSKITVDHHSTGQKQHEIERCLGFSPQIEVDFFSAKLLADDILLLCSDGLWNMVPHDAIEDMISGYHRQPTSLAGLAESLLKQALDAGGNDNISLILARLEDEAL